MKKKKTFADLINGSRFSTGVRVVKKYQELDKIPDIKNFKHFINCEISPDICPLSWDELERVDENDTKRYCKFCKNYVYRIDDEMSLKAASKTNECIAISVDLLEKINGRWDKKIIENYKKRLLISKLFLLFKVKYPKIWREFKEKNLDYEKILKEIFEMILDEKVDVKFFIDNNLDLVEVVNLIAKHHNLKNKNELISKLNSFKSKC
jgi:hypothetical protein